ncbi:MAG: porin [Candidatus Thiothrix moscowensis]|nr:porin [Candidatus Thiothrix moscowensis]
MKKLLVIAVAAGLIAPAAAMADTTLYGKLHASVGSVKTSPGAGGASTTETGVESHSSRFGVKGSTALDNGLSATYGLEYGLDIDGDNNGNSTAVVGTADSRAIAARNTFVGVKGGFGEVRVGRHDTPAKLATAGQDIFADTYADLGNIIASDNHRVNNAVAYINKFGPVGFAAAHSTGIESDVSAVTGEANTMMVNYSNGPWYAGLGHTNVQTLAKVTNLGLGWKAEAGHTANLVYETAKGGSNAAAAAAVATAIGTPGEKDVKDTNIMLNGAYKMGNVTLKGQVGESKRKGSAVATNNGKEKLTTVGVDYSLGKKTSVYLLHSINKNTNKDTVVSDDKVTATAVGLVTEF